MKTLTNDKRIMSKTLENTSMDELRWLINMGSKIPSLMGYLGANSQI